MSIKGVITVAKAAQVLGMGVVRVRFLIRKGRIQAMKHGSVWLVDLGALKRFKVRKTGAPGHFKKK